MNRERRVLSGQVEMRAAQEGAPKQIAGYAAVFNSPTEIGNYFVEKIAPGAFTAAIGRDDVRALFNHDENIVLGRTTAGTLKLSEDDRGLAYEITPPDTTSARDLAVSITRGDVNQSSFCFRAIREEWDESGPLPVRTILEAELYDVSPVTFPAYDDTEVGCRSLAAAREARAKPAAAPGGARLRLKIKGDLFAR